MKQKLSNSQVRILLGISKQKEEIQQQAIEIQEAERDYMNMLVQHYGLEDGEYHLSQQGKEIFIVKQEKPAWTEEKVVEKEMNVDKED
jgi:hypothetical protein